MSDNQDDLYDESLPDQSPQEEGQMLKYIIVGVLAILLYAVVTLLVTLTGISF